MNVTYLVKISDGPGKTVFSDAINSSHMANHTCTGFCRNSLFSLILYCVHEHIICLEQWSETTGTKIPFLLFIIRTVE